MSLRASLNKLIRRNPGALTLRERSAILRGDLDRRTVVAGTLAAAVPLPALAAPPQQERAEYRARLLAAYAENRLARPVGSVGGYTLEHEAAGLAYRRCFDIACEVIALPPPATGDGLALTALAAAILNECGLLESDPAIRAAVGLTRAVLSFTGTSLPPGFVGFGDEPDFDDRDEVSVSGEYVIPEWAIEQAKAARTA